MSTVTYAKPSGGRTLTVTLTREGKRVYEDRFLGRERYGVLGHSSRFPRMLVRRLGRAFEADGYSRTRNEVPA